MDNIKWSTVEDALPDSNTDIQYVIWCLDDTEPHLAFYDGNNTWDDSNYGFRYNVTHWMNIPAPPTKKHNWQ